MANDPLPLLLVGGAGLGYYLWSTGHLSGLGLPQPAPRATGPGKPLIGAGGSPLTVADATETGQGGSPAPVGISPGKAVGGAVAGSGSAAGLAAQAGLSAGLIGATAGLAAGGLLLSWAIVDKGLFRGGEEGVKVNPARDAFFNSFVQGYYPGAGV